MNNPIADVSTALREQGIIEFYRWLAEHDREVAASAWDEGSQNGASQNNPYRMDVRHP